MSEEELEGTQGDLLSTYDGNDWWLPRLLGHEPGCLSGVTEDDVWNKAYYREEIVLKRGGLQRQYQTGLT